MESLREDLKEIADRTQTPDDLRHELYNVQKIIRQVSASEKRRIPAWQKLENKIEELLDKHVTTGQPITDTDLETTKDLCDIIT